MTRIKITAVVSVDRKNANLMRLRLFKGDKLDEPLGPAYTEPILRIARRLYGLELAFGKNQVRVFSRDKNTLQKR